MKLEQNINEIEHLNERVNGKVSSINAKARTVKNWKSTRRSLVGYACLAAISLGITVGGFKAGVAVKQGIAPKSYYQTNVITYDNDGNVSNSTIKGNKEVEDYVTVSFSEISFTPSKDISNYTKEDLESLITLDVLKELVETGEATLADGKIIKLDADKITPETTISVYSNSEYISNGRYNIWDIVMGIVGALIAQFILFIFDAGVLNELDVESHYVGLLFLIAGLLDYDVLPDALDDYSEAKDAKKYLKEVSKELKALNKEERKLFEELEKNINDYVAVMHTDGEFYDQLPVESIITKAEALLAKKIDYLAATNVKKYMR